MRIHGKTIVLSDIHFGTFECSIGTFYENRELPQRDKEVRESNIGHFITYLNGLGDVRRIILLGDVFDLQLSSVSTAIKTSAAFLEQLQSIRTLREIVYIPGNHDHLIWFLHVFGRHVIGELKAKAASLANGDFRVCSYPEQACNIFCDADSFLFAVFGKQFKVTVLYPYLRETVGGQAWERKYLFTHGHFFDRRQTLYFDLVRKVYPMAADILRLDFGRITDPNIDELELYCSPLYNMFTMFGHTP